MQKIKQSQDKNQLFSFNNSFKNSCAASPSSSNNVSFHQAFSSNFKSISKIESFSLTDSGSPFLFHQSNKENHPVGKINNFMKRQDQSICKSKERSLNKSKERIIKNSIEKPTVKPKEKKNKKKEDIQINNLPSIQFDISGKYDSKENKEDGILKVNRKSMQNSKRIENIKVFVRVKPEKNEQCKRSIEVLSQKVIKSDDNFYCFDHIFDQASSQQSVFDNVASNMCAQLFEGYNGTIFAYGQTGSGKTYTIFGQTQPEKQGLIGRCINKILSQTGLDKSVKIKCSMAQLYKQQIIDMLGGGSDLKLKENKAGVVFIEGLKQVLIQSEDQMINLVKQAAKGRKVSSTKLNEESSRSHTILTISLLTERFTSKLCLIDLAGSQKVCKSGAEGEAFEQTKKINYSLSCLGNVINALTTRSKVEHIPFRDSKITRLLKDSLTGNFLTSIIINCSIAQQSHSETISSLKFAERAKKIKVNVQSLLEQEKQKETISKLHSIIKKLENDLENTTQQLNEYKQRENSQSHMPRQRRRSRQKIFDNIPAFLQKPKEQKIVHPQQERSQSCESELTARNPIPSERAHIEENIKKYCERVDIKPKKRQNSDLFFLNEFSSLNVSKSMKPLDTSPDISSLEFKCDESPDISLSFSIHGESRIVKQL